MEHAKSVSGAPEWRGDAVLASPEFAALPEEQQNELTAIASIFADAVRCRFVAPPARPGPVAAAHAPAAAAACAQPVLLLPVPFTGKVMAHLSVQFTPAYPAEAPVFKLHSSVLPKESLNEISASLQEEAQRLLAVGEVVVYTLALKAEECVQQVPLALTSEYFVCCPACNVRLLKKKQSKLPMPADRVAADDDWVYECMVCHSRETLYVEAFRRNAEPAVPCDFCFCEENPILHLSCGEKMCITCFQQFAALAVGRRNLARNEERKCHTLACPNHPAALFEDLKLLKLTDPSTYARFNLFAFEDGAKRLGAVTCPLPGCSNTPFLPDLESPLLYCPFCFRYFCKVCKGTPVDCRCEALPAEKRILYRSDSDTALKVAPPPEPPPGVWPPPPPKTQRLYPILVRYVDRDVQLQVGLDTCAMHIRRMLKYHLRVRVRDMRVLYCGRNLSDEATMREEGILLGSVLFLLTVAEQAQESRKEEVDLWEFRRQSGRYAAGSEVKKVYKECPHCQTPVIHYHYHGCHHIGYAGNTCCGQHWCFVCRGPHPCPTCPLFCTETCGCPPCPECCSYYRCGICTGCPKCRRKDELEDDPGHLFD